MIYILTGASRGIGRALALELAASDGHELVLVARDGAALENVAAAVRERGGQARVEIADLGTAAAARELASALAGEVEGATLVNNAGIWPSKRELNGDGHERAFGTNHVAPLALTTALLEAKALARVFTVGAGLMIKGRIDPDRTPTGADFSSFRTYCTTKLCLALALKDVAAEHPDVDFAVGHPGVVRTALGDRGGPLGWLLRRVKRGWESPEDCARRLAGLLRQPRWSTPGEATWYVEDRLEPWPDVPREGELRAWLRTTAGG